MTRSRHSTRRLRSDLVLHEWAPEADARGVVVVQHGFGEHAERYVDLHHGLVGHLLGLDVEVWALDLWGHGASPGRRGRTHVGRAVDDHQEVLRQASARGLPVLAFGHSLGGLVTAASVAVDPHAVTDVVLSSPALPDPLPALGRRLLGAAALVAPGVPIPERRRPLAEAGRAPGLVEATTADPLMHQGQVPLLLAATALDAAGDVRRAAPAWTTPTLVVHGTGDTYTDHRASQALVGAIGPVAELHLVDGGFHELLEDLDRDDVLVRVLDWMRRRLA